MVNTDDLKVNKQATLNLKGFVKAYKNVLKELGDKGIPSHITIVNAIAIFTNNLQIDNKKLVDLFSKLKKEEEQSTDILFSLAYCQFINCVKGSGHYFFTRHKHYLHLFDTFWPVEELKSTINLFQELKNDNNRSFIRVLLSICYGMLEGYNRVKKYFKKIDSTKFHRFEKGIVQDCLRLGIALSRLKSINIYYNKGKRDKIIKTFARCGNNDINFLEKQGLKAAALCYSFFLFDSYASSLRLERAQIYLKRCKKIAPNFPDIYELSAWIYAMFAQYDKASCIFLEAMKIYKHFKRDDTECKVGYEFSQGMLAWQQWAKEGKNLNKVYKHFYNCSNLVEDNKEDEYFINFRILPKFVKLDEQIKTLSLSHDLQDLRIRVFHLLQDIVSLGMEFEFIPKSNFDFVFIKLPPIIEIGILFHIKYFYLMYLYLSLQKNGFKGYAIIKPKKTKISKSKFFDNVLISYEKLLLKTNFSKTAQAFGHLKTFRKLIRNRSIEHISEYESRLLVRSLNQYWPAIDSGISLAGISSNLQNIQKNTNITRKEIKEVKEEIKTLKFHDKEPEVPEPPEEKKIKILTNAKVDDKGKACGFYKEIKPRWIDESEFEKRKENKKEYIIWMNYENGEVFVFGKPFASGRKKKPCKNSLGFRKLIVFLLEKQEYHPYEDVFKIYTGDEYLHKDEQRKRINKVASKLRKYSKGLLKENIHYDPSRSFGLNTKGLPFCITYKKLY